MQMTPDDELMRRIASGDALAFDTLVRRHLPKAFAVARRILPSREDAEEAAQDAFNKIWVKAPLWQPEKARFTTWLYRVVVNAALDIARKRTPRGVAQSEEMLAAIADATPASDVQMVAHEEAVAVREAVASLTAQQRAAITLCYFEHHTNPQAAAVMGLHVKALEGLLVRARRALREQLEKRKEARHAA